ncbi:MAG: ribonuclease III [Woeseiaceae bacterium]|nr:ribonuclease III [Woeseiaceae bacterium]
MNTAAALGAARATPLDKAAAWLQQSLAYEFSDRTLLKRALTHRSAVGSNNERLEFLGDAVLDLVVTEMLFERTRGTSEGQLSRLRAGLVKDATLAEIASELRVGEHLILGPGEKKSGGHHRSSILADAMEAIFAAVYLDAGLAAVREVIRCAYGPRFDELPESDDLRDPKSRLQELLQSRQLALPAYALEKTSGKAHRQTFEVSCSVAELNSETRGTGTSRRDAEQAAAQAMLETIERHD